MCCLISCRAQSRRADVRIGVAIKEGHGSDRAASETQREAVAHHAVGHTVEAEESFWKGTRFIEKAGPAGPGEPASVGNPSKWVALILQMRQAQAALARPATRPTTAPTTVPATLRAQP